MEIKKLFKRKGTLLAFIAMMLSVQSMFGQDALTSLKFTVKNIALSTNQKEISYDVYVKDIDAANVAVSPAFTVRLMVPQADLGTNAKTVTVTNGTPELGASYATMTTSGTNWLMKFTQNSIALTWASALTISDTGDGTRLGTFHITNTDGTSFTNPVPFNLTFSGTTISTKSSISLFLLNSTTLAPNSTTAQPATNFIGFGPYSLVAATTPLTISSPTITLSKSYDGTTTAAVTAGTLSGVAPADAANVAVSATATYDNATVGTGKTITVHYTLSGSAAGSYSAPADYTVTTGVITAPVATQLTISSPTITLSKAYDGTTGATVVAGALSGVAPADAANVSVSATAVYNNSTVGTGKTITVTYILSGSAASSYLAPVSSSVTTGVITALPLTVTTPTITLSKVYNGTTSAAVTAGTLSGVLPADAANVSVSATAGYNNSTVGTGKTITVTYSLSGSAVANYTAPASTNVTTGVITALPLTVSAPTITLSKAYDGTTAAVVTAGTLSGVLPADVANVTLNATAAYDNATVGTGKTITVTYSLSGSAVANYSAPTSTSVTTGVITDPPLDALTSIKFTVKNIALSTNQKEISYDVYVKDIDAVNVTVSPAFTVRLMVPQADLGTNAKTVTVTNGTPELGASYATMTTSGTNWLMKFTQNSIALTWASALTISDTGDGTRLGTFHITNTDGTSFTNPVPFNLTFSGTTISTKSSISLFLLNSTTLAPNSTTAQPATNFIGFGAYSLSVATTQLTASAPTITLSKVSDGTTSAAVTAGTLSGVLPADAANVTLNATATYDNSTVGTGKTITVHYTLSGSAAGSYSAPTDYTVTTGVITAAVGTQLTISSPTITLSKAYDGTTAAVVTAGTLSGVAPADAANVSLSATATYDNSTVGTGKTITVTYSLSGSAASSYIAPVSSSVTTGVITVLPLTVSAPTITLSKVYNGTATAAVTAGTLSGVLAADAANVTLNATAAYDNATEGTGKTITVTYSLSGSAVANYSAPASTSVTTGVITAAVGTHLTISSPTITLSKAYDGTTAAVVTAGTLSGVAPADAANVSLSATATYDNSTVGTGKTITVTYSLSGSAASSYIAPVSSSVTTGVITVLPLTVSAPTITLSKVYNGTTSAAVTAGTLSGVLAADAANVTLNATAAYDNATEGTGKTITVTYSLSGTAASNYTAPASSSVTTGVISAPAAVQLSISSPTITLSKEYDGTAIAVVTAGTLSGVAPADAANVSVSATATSDNSTVGTGKTITVTYSLSGSAASSYLAPVSSSVTTGVITALPLTVSAPTITLSKVYNGTTSAAVTAGTLSGVLAADAANVTLNATAAYDNATEGTGKTITVTYSLSGTAASNYTAPASSSVTTGVISAPAAVQLSISSPTITLSKEYDGTATAVVTAGTLSGVSGGDAANVSLSATATYADATVGTGKTITVTYSLSGSAVSSYLAPASSSVTTGVITALPLTVTAPTITLSKVYNGTATAAVTAGTLLGVLPADASNVSVTATASYADATVGTGKTITVTYSLSGSAASNYTAPASSSVTTGVITAVSTVQLTVADPTNTFSKEYDGTTSAVVVSGTLSGVELADVNNVILTAIGTYDDASAGTGKAVTVNYSLSGSAAYKYSILPVKTYSNGEIKRKQLSILNVKVVTNKVIDGNTMAVVSYNGDLQGVLAIDANNVSVKAVANYDNATVGVNKTITVVYTLAGTAKDNYVAPTETVINNAEITDVIILNSLDASQTMSCEGSDLVLLYRVISGTPTKWRFSYSGAAQVTGINNSVYNDLSTPSNDGTVSIVVPTTGMLPGIYTGSLQVQNELGIESPVYTFQFTVNVSSDNVVKMYDDVVTCDNSSNRFVAYQWYKDGFAISGATKQFYCEQGGLNGTYSVQVTTIDGQVLNTCSKTFASSHIKTVNAYPNPIRSNQALTVQADGFDNLELENSTLSVYDTFGTLVYKSTKVEKLNMLNLPLAPKVYVGHIKLKNGSDYVFKVIVE